MNEEFSNKRKTSVDDLNEQLYYRKGNSISRPRREIRDRNIDLDHDFPDDELEALKKRQSKRTLPTSFFKKMFLGVLGFFILTAIVVGASFYSGTKTVSGDLISMEIIGQPLIDGVENLQLDVRIQNFNEKAVELPDLVLSYSKDSGDDGEKVFLRRSLEDIGYNDRVAEEFNIVLFGQEGAVRNIDATLEYRIDGSNAIFVKEADFEVIIRSTPTVVAVNAPTQMVRGQVFEMEVTIASNSNTIVNNNLLTIDYPSGFELLSTSPTPDAFDHIWSIPLLGDEKETFVIKGRLSALEGQGQSFGINFGKQNTQNQNEIETLLNTIIHTVDVQRPFIITDLLVNGSDDSPIAIRGGSEVQGEVTLVNTLNDALQDVSVTLRLEGNLFDQTGIRAQNGFFDSNTRTIRWDKATLPDLGLLQPGQEKNLSFTLPTVDLVGQTGSVVNPELVLRVDVSAVEINGKVQSAENLATSTVIANSDIGLITDVQHEEGLFNNYGPMPPRVNEKTSYTLNLQVTNSSNEIENAELRFFLPSYVSWTDAIAPSIERSSVDFNETTREVRWRLGTLRSGLGVSGSSPRSLSMQVEVLPSSSQSGDQISLTSDIILNGKDTFTDAQLSFRKTEVENRLGNSSETGSDGRIRN